MGGRGERRRGGEEGAGEDRSEQRRRSPSLFPHRGRSDVDDRHRCRRRPRRRRHRRGSVGVSLKIQIAADVEPSRSQGPLTDGRRIWYVLRGPV